MSEPVGHTVQQRVLVACGRARTAASKSRGHLNELRSAFDQVKCTLPPSIVQAVTGALASLQAAHMSYFTEINEISSEFTGSHSLPKVRAEDLELHPAFEGLDHRSLAAGEGVYKGGDRR